VVPEPSTRVSSRQPVVSLESKNMLSILFYNIHGSEQELELEKKTKPLGSSSRYNGVCIRNVKSCSSFEASFLAFRLGNKYILETGKSAFVLFYNDVMCVLISAIWPLHSFPYLVAFTTHIY
jgi:hypothetical protein